MTAVSSVLMEPVSKAVLLQQHRHWCHTLHNPLKHPKRGKTLENLENHKEDIIQGDKND